MPAQNPFFIHSSDDLREEVTHIQQFLARAFSARQARSADPRLSAQRRVTGPLPAVAAAASSGSSSGVLAGDVAGPAATNEVTAIQGVTVTLTSPVTGQVLSFNGTALVSTSTVGALTLTGNLTLSGHNLATDTTTGTQIGTSAAQKLALWGQTPGAQPPAYTVTNATPNRALDEAAATLAQVAQVLGTLVQDLQSRGFVG